MNRFELKAPGDRIDHGDRITRYAMAHDTYMNTREVGNRANDLWAAFDQSLFRSGLLAQIAVSLGLASDGVGDLDAVMILAKAQVTWSDIGDMKS
jgi:hypothetical protein